MFSALITPAELSGRASTDPWVLLDCRFDLAHPEAGLVAYLAGHIPGSQYANLEKDLATTPGPETGRHPLPDTRVLAGRIGNWGIGPDTQVVCYDEQSGAFAARLWWLLRWLGHTRVAVLEGGWKRWTEEGYPVSTRTPRVEPTHFPAAPQADWVITTKEVQARLADPDFRLLDARAAKRFRGDVEPIDPVAGHIPGAINMSYEDNLDADGRFLSAIALRDRYQGLLAGTDPRQCAAMCGSGVTACHTLLAMEIAGLPVARLYAGSWSEWIRDPSRPVGTGNG